MTSLFYQRLSRSIIVLRRHCATQSSFDEEFIAAARNLYWRKLTDPAHLDAIRRNIARRKGVGDIDRLHELCSRLGTNAPDNLEAARLAWQIPNETSASTPDDENEVVAVVVPPSESNSARKAVLGEAAIKRQQSALDVKYACGHRSYAFTGTAARLARALLRCSVDFVLQHDTAFEFVNVPEIVDRIVAEGCGADTSRSMVYRVREDKCLSGTGEIGIAATLRNHCFDADELPRKLLTVTRCYRREADAYGVEQGIYRVHEFDKAEMFIVCRPEESEQMHEHLLQLQSDFLSKLGLHYSAELGAAAHAKYDCEAYFHGRAAANVTPYGEVTSTSNCTDYQSRRLNITYKEKDGCTGFVHTCNGTAAACTRLLLAVLEQAVVTHKFQVAPLLKPYLEGIDLVNVAAKVL